MKCLRSGICPRRSSGFPSCFCSPANTPSFSNIHLQIPALAEVYSFASDVLLVFSPFSGCSSVSQRWVVFKNTGRLCPTLTLTDLSPRRVGILINRGRAGTDFVCEPANFAFVSAGAEMAKLCNIPLWRWLFAQAGGGDFHPGVPSYCFPRRTRLIFAVHPRLGMCEGGADAYASRLNLGSYEL